MRDAGRWIAVAARFLVVGVIAAAALFVLARVFLPPSIFEQTWTAIAIWAGGMLLGLLEAFRWCKRKNR